MLIGFHGTSYQNAKEILRHGFTEDHFPDWTSDLGRGAYGYIAVPEMPFATPTHIAAEYARLKADMHGYGQADRRASGNPRISVVEFRVDVADEDICDFNNPEQYRTLIGLKRRFEAFIHAERTFTSGAAYRDNEDGILIEYLIRKRLMRDYHLMVMDTYTPLFAKMSNFANGREICVRHIGLISKVDLYRRK
ncbi:hypothetical protein [Schleiferilactobacillus harbinensis]|uniref:hypothetical protein n=1 Tax=Schleiferilactobacillus harbinensis TaxID=304207 RepID=UPI0039E825A6